MTYESDNMERTVVEDDSTSGLRLGAWSTLAISYEFMIKAALSMLWHRRGRWPASRHPKRLALVGIAAMMIAWHLLYLGAAPVKLASQRLD